MGFYLNATSPYVRLARIVLIEKGLADTVTLSELVYLDGVRPASR